jgi:hypothetical protein
LGRALQVFGHGLVAGALQGLKMAFEGIEQGCFVEPQSGDFDRFLADSNQQGAFGFEFFDLTHFF